MLTATSGALRSETCLVENARELLDLAPDEGPLVFLECPARGEALLATGIAIEVRARGERRFADAARALRAALAPVRCGGAAGPGPIAVGGFAFDDGEPRDERWRAFGALSLVVPRQAWLRRGGRTWRIDVAGGSEPAPESHASPAATPRSAAPIAPNPACTTADDEDRARASWRERVTAALDAIEAGALRKVVLARERTTATPDDLDPRDVVRHLRDERPSCTTFWVRRGGRSFVGSSPELLARVDGSVVEAVALAGTAPARNDGDDDIQGLDRDRDGNGNHHGKGHRDDVPPEGGDARAIRELLACPKNAAEHAFVAGEICEALGAVCADLIAAERVVEKVPEALHLATRFRGVLRDHLCALEVAGLLHPTSAVCGLPRRSARALIQATEGERGWYAGGIGWVDAAGNGEFCVALRCGLLEPCRATLWAGAGIVAGSRPDAEFDETTTKMQAMLRTLAAGSPGAEESEVATAAAYRPPGDIPRDAANEAVT